MVNKIYSFIVKYRIPIAVIISICIIAILTYCTHKHNNIIKEINNVEYIDSAKTYHKIYQSNDFKNLKKENRELYDSLKKYKKEISYLTQFKYRKTYTIVKTVEKPVKVVVEKIVNNDTLKVYEYTNKPNDSLSYTLKIGSYKKPEWYELKAVTNDKFTLVNKTSNDGTNHLTIESSKKGEISNVTVFNKKYHKKLWERFRVGPSFIAGYDPIHKDFSVMIGVGLMIDITK